MSAYLIIIEILLLALMVYESYKYFIFKYRSILVEATIKEIEEYEVFQRPSTKAFEGQKKAVKVMLEYTLNKKTFIKKERIKKNIINAKVGDTIKIKVVKNDPEQCSLKPDSIRFRRMVLTIMTLLVWSVLVFIIQTTS
ncbi:hypothetical protein [Aquimarina litoralis]|uniref:hypothetical protein n=1 Tax=Aquimarina litoralis TaxID=584605 RepID=UPI001C58F9FE|nr:hypothetical protein [Aquimarina litoralis]MBW1295820.1 hypothetical protein [Aquimarina litoralis]